MADYILSYTGAQLDAAINNALELPTIAGGDAGKTLKVNSGETAYEAVDEYTDAEIDTAIAAAQAAAIASSKSNAIAMALVFG